jgi:hypothetical protein
LESWKIGHAKDGETHWNAGKDMMALGVSTGIARATALAFTVLVVVTGAMIMIVCSGIRCVVTIATREAHHWRNGGCEALQRKNRQEHQQRDAVDTPQHGGSVTKPPRNANECN